MSGCVRRFAQCPILPALTKWRNEGGPWPARSPEALGRPVDTVGALRESAPGGFAVGAGRGTEAAAPTETDGRDAASRARSMLSPVAPPPRPSSMDAVLASAAAVISSSASAAPPARGAIPTPAPTPTAAVLPSWPPTPTPAGLSAPVPTPAPPPSAPGLPATLPPSSRTLSGEQSYAISHRPSNLPPATGPLATTVPVNALVGLPGTSSFSTCRDRYGVASGGEVR